jgi:histone H3/H4
MHDCIANIERWLAGDSSIDLKATRKVAKAATRSGAAATRAVAAAVARAASTVASSATETTIAAGDVAWAVSLAAPWELRNKAVLAEYQAQRDDLVALFGLYAAKEKRKA